MWVLVIVLAIALMIPITAILVDSPLGRPLPRRREAAPTRLFLATCAQRPPAACRDGRPSNE